MADMRRVCMTDARVISLSAVERFSFRDSRMDHGQCVVSNLTSFAICSILKCRCWLFRYLTHIEDDEGALKESHGDVASVGIDSWFGINSILC